MSGASHQALTVDGAKAKLTTHRETSAIPLPVCAEAKTFTRRGERYQVLDISPGQGRTGGGGGGGEVKLGHQRHSYTCTNYALQSLHTAKSELGENHCYIHHHSRLTKI